MIDVSIPFRAEHGRQMADHMTEQWISKVEGFDWWLEAIELSPSVTISLDRVPMVGGGIVPIWPGLAEARVIVDDRARGHVSIARAVKVMWPRLVAASGARRIQSAIRADDGYSKKLMSWLGFEQEGTLRRLFPDGSDGLIYALLPEGGNP